MKRNKVFINKSVRSSTILFQNALIIMLAALAYYSVPQSAGYKILVITIGTIFFIILGPRLQFEKFMEDKALPGREAWASIFVLVFSLFLGLVEFHRALNVFLEKIDIIAFIFSFAILSNGISKSGYFHYVAYQIVERCRGNSLRLNLYLFIMTSIFTFLTSNDIVILVLTPIIISVAVHANIKNIKLILLSQFVAANTLSMGLMIGSPTNIILAKALGYNFVSYAVIMLPVAVLAFLVAFAVVDFINKGSNITNRNWTRLFFSRSWHFSEEYRVPHFSKHQHLTREMKYWRFGFGVAVLWIIVVTYFELSLLYSAVPTGIAAALLYYITSTDPVQRNSKRIHETLAMSKNLPWGVLFFGMVFFILTDALATSNMYDTMLLPVLRELITGDVGFTGFAGALIGGLSVNIFNDLPASALVAKILIDIGFTQTAQQTLATQGFLVGLNIGCYLTPIGALAGLIWFNAMAKAKKEFEITTTKGTDSDSNNCDADIGVARQQELEKIAKEIELPSRIDLIRYGFIHFVVAVLFLGAVLPFLALIQDFLTGPTRADFSSEFAALVSTNTILPESALWLIGGAVCLGLLVVFIKSSQYNKIALTHLREAFGVMNGFRIWAERSKILYGAGVSILIVFSAGLVLYISENVHHAMYAAQYAKLNIPLDTPLDGSIKSFSIWFLVFIGSGFEQGFFPRSVLGTVIVGAMPLILVSLIVFSFRLFAGNNRTQLAYQQATGELSVYRTVIINFQPVHNTFVRQLLDYSDCFILLICEPEHIGFARALESEVSFAGTGMSRIYVSEKNGEPESLYEQFQLKNTAEIYLMASTNWSSSFENLQYLTLLDKHVNLADGQAKNLPKLVVEVTEDRIKDLVERSTSVALYDRLVFIEFERTVATFLEADSSQDIYKTNHFFHFSGDENKLVHEILCEGCSSLFQGRQLTEYAITEDEIPRIQRFFSWAEDPSTQLGKSRRHVREKAVSRKARLEDDLLSNLTNTFLVGSHNGRNLDDGNEVVGFSMLCGKARVRLDIPSTSICNQANNIDGVVFFKSGLQTPGSLPGGSGRIIIANINPFSTAFVRQLLENNTETYKILIFADNKQYVPSFIINASVGAKPKLVLINDYEPGTNNLVDAMMPLHPKNKLATLMESDRVYLFLRPHYHEHTDGQFRLPDIENIDFIDRLEGRLYGADKCYINHDSIYVAVEAHGKNTRFLFEHLLIDQVYDSTWIRRSYLNNLSLAYYKPQQERHFRQRFERSDKDFAQAHKIAQYLCPFIVIPALNARITTSGENSTPVIGMKYGDVRKNIRVYSEPQMQLIGLFKFVQDKYERIIRIQPIDATQEYEIQNDDILINLPLI